MPIAKKCTILIPSGPASNAGLKHLFIVCTDECAAGKHLIVPVTTWTNALCDDTCVLLPHDHSFIRHKSYILYRNAKIEAAVVLARGVEEGFFRFHDEMNGQSFLRVAKGVCRSPHSPRKIKAYANCEIA